MQPDDQCIMIDGGQCVELKCYKYIAFELVMAKLVLVGTANRGSFIDNVSHMSELTKNH